jgi:ABC-type thiamine transport system ATPase subunit
LRHDARVRGVDAVHIRIYVATVGLDRRGQHHGRKVAAAAAQRRDLGGARLVAALPEEVKEGTITLTNFGISGVQIGIPIIYVCHSPEEVKRLADAVLTITSGQIRDGAPSAV